MFKKFLHYIVKYSLMLLVYLLVLMLLDKVFGLNYFILITTTTIYSWLICKKILVFSSSWVDDK